MKSQYVFQFGHIMKPDLYHGEPIARGVLGNCDQLGVIHKQAFKKIDEIRDSKTLTLDGKLEALRDLVRNVEGELEGLKATIAGYNEQADRIAETIKPKRHPRDDLAYAIEQVEIRRHINSLDPAEAEGFVLSAIETGDEQTMEAVRFAPVKFRFITSDLIERIDQQRCAAQFPEETKKLADLRLASRETRSALASVAATLRQQGVEISRWDKSSAVAA